jgi:post-segregation antitoxin (ccd killing protein)
MRTLDLAGNPRVLSVGVDLMPVLRDNGIDVSRALGEGMEHEDPVRVAARVLRIGWVEEALDTPQQTICRRSSKCPRNPSCHGLLPGSTLEIADVRASIEQSIRRRTTEQARKEARRGRKPVSAGRKK